MCNQHPSICNHPFWGNFFYKNISIDFIRKRNRLPFKELYKGGYWYFVTVCVQDKKCIFVEEPLRFQDDQFELNKIGKQAESLLQQIPELFSEVIIDEYIIMPNHIHAIIGFGKKVYYKNGINRQSLSDVIGKYKSILWTRVKNELDWNGKRSATIWQKSFYDHIIRNDKDLDRVREYIINNPLNWHLDSLNPINAKKSTAKTHYI